MGSSLAPFVVVLFVFPLLNARVTVSDAIGDETILSREGRFTNGEDHWTHGNNEQSSSASASVSPSNTIETPSTPIVLKPLQLTLVHKSVFNLKPDIGHTSRQERNLGGSSYSCLSCFSEDNTLFERSVSRSGKFFSSPSDSAISPSLEQNSIKEIPKKISTQPIPLTWKSLLYKPRKSVVRGFLASPGKPIKQITEFSLISKYNDNPKSKNAINPDKDNSKKSSIRPKFTITPAVVKHIPLSFTETNEIFHNLLVKFVSRKKNKEELQRDSQSYENNEIRRVGVPISNFTPNTQRSSIITSENLPLQIYRQYRQTPQVSRIVPATLVFKHFSSSHQRR